MRTPRQAQLLPLDACHSCISLQSWSQRRGPGWAALPLQWNRTEAQSARPSPSRSTVAHTPGLPMHGVPDTRGASAGLAECRKRTIIKGGQAAWQVTGVFAAASLAAGRKASRPGLRAAAGRRTKEPRPGHGLQHLPTRGGASHIAAVLTRASNKLGFRCRSIARADGNFDGQPQRHDNGTA